MTERERLIVNSIITKVQEKDPNAEIILYGSHARGDNHEESDWDILILLQDNNVDLKKEQEFRHHIFDLELEIGEPISVYVHSKNDWKQKYAYTPFFKNIKDEGILLT
jgi:predicted nucleotidyltransferase